MTPAEAALARHAFAAAVARDYKTVAIPETVNAAAFGQTSFLAVSAIDTTIKTPAVGECVIQMGPYDALELSVLGTDAAGEIAETYVELLEAGVNAPVDQVAAWYDARFLASQSWTLGATTAGATGRPSGVDAGDLWAHQVVMTSAGAGGFVTHSPGSDGKAFVILPADQAWGVRVRARITTAASVLVMARRLQGAAQRD